MASRPPEKLTVTVLRLRYMKGTRGDSLCCMVRAEYNDAVLGESIKVESSAADGSFEMNFSSSITVTFDDYKDLDEVAYKPVLLTFTEVLPKEKKQKEEKTVPLGQCTVDLFPMLKADATKYRSTLTVHPVQGSPLETLPPDVPKPEVDVQLSVLGEPLVSSALTMEANLMSITAENLFSPPDSWQPSANLQHAYVAALPIPVSTEKENTITFTNGVLKPGADKEPPSKQKKWLAPGANTTGSSVFIPDSRVTWEGYDKEDGDYRGKEDRDHRISAENEKNRICWNTERRCYLEPPASKLLQERISKQRVWPVEVMRVPLPSGGKGKKEEEYGISFHGVAYVNLAPLLYPGVTKIKGAYKIVPFTEHDYYEKCKRRQSVADEAFRAVHGQINRGGTSPSPKKGGGNDKKGDPKKGKGKDAGDDGSGNAKSSEMASDSDQQPNVEGQQYADHKSYLTIEIILARPLVAKKPPEELARRVASIVPPRPLFPKRVNGAQKSVEDYHRQIASVAGLILDECKDVYGPLLAGVDDGLLERLPIADLEEHRRKLVYQLNSTGKYFAFKEQLKYAIVKIVREKYLKTSSFTTKEEEQMFLSDLYVYLVDEMHVSLGKVLSLEDKTPVPPPVTTSAQLRHFSHEAEASEDFDLAAEYYKERISRDRNDAEPWLDYGTFCLSRGDTEKAIECFRECIAVNQSHLNGLMLYGVVCEMEERNDAAETFFEAATCVNPRSVVAWTMLGLFYDGIGNDIGAEMALLEAKKRSVENARIASRGAAMRALTAAQAASRASLPAGYQHAAADDKPSDGLAAGNVPASGSGARASQTPADKTSQSKATTVRAQTDGKKSSTAVAATSKKAAGAGGGSAVGGGSQMGSRSRSQESVSSQQHQHRGASHHTAGAATAPPVKSPAPPITPDVESEPLAAAAAEITREPTPVPTKSVFMQTIEWLLEVRAVLFAERALAHQLLAATAAGGPGADYYIAMARLKLQKRELAEAEEQLEEALQLDFQNADAWAIMGHLKYMAGNMAAARDCYERTLALLGDPMETHTIYLRLSSIYLQEGLFREAKNTYLMACKSTPSCLSWLGVGIACYRLNELSEAEDALSEANVLNNKDPVVWGYLTLVSLRTRRQLQAEQSYKYANKLHLQDDSLLKEIHELQAEVGFGNPQF